MAPETNPSRKHIKYLTKKQKAVATIRQAAEQWPSPFVARKAVKEFTGGLYSTAHLANADCLKTGPEGAFRIGRGVAYPTQSFCDWLISKLEE